MENDGWKTILSFWVPVTFQGRAVKLQVGIISGKHGQLDVVFPVIVFENTSVKNGPTNRTGACNSTKKNGFIGSRNKWANSPLSWPPNRLGEKHKHGNFRPSLLWSHLQVSLHRFGDDIPGPQERLGGDKWWQRRVVLVVVSLWCSTCWNHYMVELVCIGCLHSHKFLLVCDVFEGQLGSSACGGFLQVTPGRQMLIFW